MWKTFLTFHKNKGKFATLTKFYQKKDSTMKAFQGILRIFSKVLWMIKSVTQDH